MGNEEKIILSTLGHTWILDLDGTIVKHNGYLIDGEDSFLPGAEDFLKSIPEKDMVIFLTSRMKSYEKMTLKFFADHQIRFDHIIFEAPCGERILINDDKPSGLHMSIGICTKRDEWKTKKIIEDAGL